MVVRLKGWPNWLEKRSNDAMTADTVMTLPGNLPWCNCTSDFKDKSCVAKELFSNQLWRPQTYRLEFSTLNGTACQVSYKHQVSQSCSIVYSLYSGPCTLLMINTYVNVLLKNGYQLRQMWKAQRVSVIVGDPSSNSCEKRWSLCTNWW